MNVDGESRGISRRDMLAVGVAAAAGAVSSAVLPTAAAAADGDPVLMGQINAAATGTTLEANVTGAVLTVKNQVVGLNKTGVLGISEGDDLTAGDPEVHENKSAGVAGMSSAWYGVLGVSDSLWGVFGVGGKVGVRGGSYGANGVGVHGGGMAVGVEGHTEDGIGVQGVAGIESHNTPPASPAGVGVYGKGSSVGVRADSDSGNALDVHGKAHFSRSGRALIGAGKTYRDVTCANLTTSSMILANLQGSGGSGVAVAYCARLSSTKFRVVLTKATTRSVYLAWFVLN